MRMNPEELIYTVHSRIRNLEQFPVWKITLNVQFECLKSECLKRFKRSPLQAPLSQPECLPLEPCTASDPSRG